MITSAFTLATVIRDQQEGSSVISRIDEARVQEMLADYDPFTPAKL
ncbi:hypothetical protein [Goekera deserti]|nr:hypothetical protein [Goekera deserti]